MYLDRAVLLLLGLVGGLELGNHVAVLVEDDIEQLAVSRSVLVSAGFDVVEFNSLEGAHDFFVSEDFDERCIDLLVLDRRIPYQEDGNPNNEFGDLLFGQAREVFPDAKIIVFTGYADVKMLQVAMQGAGQFPIRPDNPVDRITVLRKDQSIEFRDEVDEFAALLCGLDDIEVHADTEGIPHSVSDVRCLRRVAYEYGAVTLVPTSLSGGQTGAKVWKCTIHQAEGHIADIVVKQVKKEVVLGGLQDLLPLSASATSRGTVSGLTGGQRLAIQRLAGSNVRTLSSLILRDSTTATSCVASVAAALRSVTEQAQVITMVELASPLISWDDLVARLGAHRLTPPSPSMRVSTMIGVRHGDLHPSNVMVDGMGEVPVLIDFDSNCFAAGLLDPVTLLLSTLTHPNSPIHGDMWPSTTEISQTFGTDTFASEHPAGAWFAAVWTWVVEKWTSEREFWGLVLAYCVRQFAYKDVKEDAAVFSRVVTLAGMAISRLQMT